MFGNTQTHMNLYRRTGNLHPLLSLSSTSFHGGFQEKKYDDIPQEFQFKYLETKSDMTIYYSLFKSWNVASNDILIETPSELNFKLGDKIIIQGGEGIITSIEKVRSTGRNLNEASNDKVTVMKVS